VTRPRSQPVFSRFAGVLVGFNRAEIDRHFEFTGRFNRNSRQNRILSAKREIYRVAVSG
jgi:hypothetical protein